MIHQIEQKPSDDQSPAHEPGVCVTRRSLMNKIVAVSAAAAIPTVAPVLATESRTFRSPGQILARTKEIVDVLRACYIRKGWTLDEDAAQHAVAFCEKYAEDGSDPDDRREKTFDFFRDHGQTLDWVFDGDHQAMIAKLASFSPRANRIADAELISLTDQLVSAVAESRRLYDIADAMKNAHRNSGFPEALRIRAEDAALGRTPWEPTDKFWHRPCDIDKWRAVDDCEVDKEDSADGYVLRVRTVKAAEDLRERGEEIVAAFDKWDAEHQKEPRGYKAAKRAYEKASDIEAGLERRIRDIQATTIEGMIAKARCAEAYEFKNGTVDFSVSIAFDLLALNAVSPQAITTTAVAVVDNEATSEALELVKRCRKGNRRWDVLYEKIERAESAARGEFGRRPFKLIAWRNYSAIGGPSIEGARDGFIRDGIDEKVVRAEYRQAKKREREAVRAGEDWDRKAGLTDLR